MVDLVAKEISHLGCKSAGLLATDGTVQTGLYKNFLNKYGVEEVIPDSADQAIVMDLIYGNAGIKAGFISDQNRHALLKCCNRLLDKGVDIVILGCTELPLVLKEEDKSNKMIDPFVVLASESIRFARE